MTMRRALLLVMLAACGCGGTKTPPAASTGAGEGGAPDTPAGRASSGGGDDIKPFAGVDVEPPSSGDAGASAPSGGGANGASGASATGVPPPPSVDECTPLAVDFEKRARPKLKDCYREGKKKDPDLKGTVKIAIDINTLGKITTTKIVEKTLPEPVAQCMLKVVKATPFPETEKCPGKALTIPVTFPTPR